VECGVHRDSRSLRSRLEGGLEYISAAVLLIPLEGDLNASVGIVIATVRYVLPASYAYRLEYSGCGIERRC